MTDVTRRSLLGGVTLGALALSACDGAGSRTFAGEVAFLHGVGSGDPLPDRVILWSRVTPLSGAGPVPVRWEVFRPGETEPVSAGLTETSESRDYTIKVDAGGLAPGSAYIYRFAALTANGPVISPEGRTRTAPDTGRDPLKMGVVSCSNWHFGRFNAYRALAREPELDLIVHLGDYIYEYGIDGYGGEVGAEIGRLHDPAVETITLADYRRRHAQYKTDPDLQAAHAAVPWICTWDDHESANDSYRTGAENHNPEEGEGEWSDRKQAAMQAYFEWMPIREPVPGEVTSAVWRTFRFGDVATIHALESRLTGRSPPISWSNALAGTSEPDEISTRVQATMAEAADPARTMLGLEQEAWLARELADSVSQGVTWQVLANQVIMARVALPDFTTTLTPSQMAAQDVPIIRQMIPFTALGLPWNLDAWDGYPAARERLYEAVAASGARLVTLAGDTHTAYANELFDHRGMRRGVEFGCTSITSPGMGAYIRDVPDLGPRIAAANREVVWHDPFGNGYTLVTFTPERTEAVFRKVSTVLAEEFSVDTVAVHEALPEPGGVSALRAV